MVTVCAVLVCPAATTGKVSSTGFAVRPFVSCPVPFSDTETGATSAVEDEIASVAAITPVALGVKTTWAVQVLPPFSTVPQVVEETE